MSNALYLITVTNMKKITLFSELSQQTLIINWKNCHNYSNLTQSQILFYMQQLPMDHGTWSWYPIWGQSSQPSWRNVWGRPDGLDPSLIMSYKFQMQMLTYFITKTTSLLIFRHPFLSIRVWEIQGLKQFHGQCMTSFLQKYYIHYASS